MKKTTKITLSVIIIVLVGLVIGIRDNFRYKWDSSPSIPTEYFKMSVKGRLIDVPVPVQSYQVCESYGLQSQKLHWQWVMKENCRQGL
jgi:hypothetical protein